ncbi:hypothetical protein ACF07F_16600 [Streptomyces sp. NPDC015237]|uniref:hypothetical protein n=1 Tax=Streptomyces sp. NPDC015237 TaxID=3364949 RepID=UPI0036FC772D
MSDRIALDDLTSDQLDQLYADLDRYEEVVGELNETNTGLARRAARAEAAVARARALHRRNEHTGDCEHCSARDYPNYAVPHPCDTVRALGEPAPAATEATDLEITARVLSALHRVAQDTVTRVINLHEQWVKAGPPPLGVPLARWWDTRLAELHNAIQPADQTTEK